jgi:primosomal protein N' (replication factor Y)
MATRNFENRIKSKKLNCVYLVKDYEEIEIDIESKKIKNDKQIRILNVLKDNEGITSPDLQMLSDTTSASIKTLEKNEYIKLVEEVIERNPFENKNVEKTEKLKLTDEQQIAFDKIDNSIQNNINKEYLIYGVTGSRKNRNIFTTYPKCVRQKQNSNCASTRNLSYTTDGR